ncbi:MAG: DUF2796 domain-containing protein [Rhodospirillales bacterium]|nr:DUF2796 domain-containing protein [Rhodospirillales bacterium]
MHSVSFTHMKKESRLALPFGFAFALSALLATTALGSEREHGAHQHGHGQLNIAVEGHELEMELVSPGADIVGFEHHAESAADKQAIEEATALLKKGGTLFVPAAGAKCRLEEAHVESAMMEDDDHDHHAKEEAHGHDKEHAHEKEHEHEKEHAHEKEHGHGHADHEETHSEFHVHYHFHCDNPDRLTHIDVRFFEHFPGAEELEVQAISAKGQTAAELTGQTARFTF